MTSSFTRSLHTLRTQTAGRNLWPLLLIAGLLAGWLAWFSLARLPVYAVSESAELTGETAVVAQFAPANLLRLQPGQPARLQLDQFPLAEFGSLEAVVTRVDSAIQGDRLLVELQLLPAPQSPLPRQAGLTGRVEVEVEQLTPAALLWRTVGQRARGG